MAGIFLSAHHGSRRRPLAACVAALFGLSAQPAMALIPTTLFVNTCDEGVSNTDFTHGSLRWAAANTPTGGTIDMTAIPCSRISLETGAITLGQADLTILGPGLTNLTVSAEHSANGNKYYMKDRIFNHTGTGKLKVYDLTVEKGYYKSAGGTAKGGCIYSKGDLYLKHVGVYLCDVLTDTGAARGGGVFGLGEVQLKYSTVGVNTANSGASGSSTGGGVYSGGFFGTTAAVIKYNQATGATGTHHGFYGGVWAKNDAFIIASTISGNSATQRVGGIAFSSSTPGSNGVTLLASTISGNSSEVYVGGMYSDAAKTYLLSSTVAFNTAAAGKKGSKYYSPGFMSSSTFGSLYIGLENSLLSNNTYGTTEVDLSTYDGVGNSTTFNTAAPNVVRNSKLGSVGGLPSGTIAGSCPLLGVLRDNGGLTLTHALLSHSVAIDAGSNPFSASNDQRGPGYVRPDSKTGVPDIGAYEVQQNDIVFNSGVDGCLSLF